MSVVLNNRVALPTRNKVTRTPPTWVAPTYSPDGDPPGVWILQSEFSDEFASLDTDKWNNDVNDWGTWHWEPANTAVAAGVLTITMDYYDYGDGIYYSSGILRSKALPIKYGYFEISMKGPSLYPGMCPAFWLYRYDTSPVNIWTEIDIQELTQLQPDLKNTGSCGTHVFVHPTADLTHLGWFEDLGFDPSADFHTYACDWSYDGIDFYVDGSLYASTKTDERADVELAFRDQALDLVISMGLRPPLTTTPSAVGFPATMECEYVRVWKNAAS